MAIGDPIQNWSPEPPWRQEWIDDPEGFDCARCGDHIDQYWRHFWQPCRRCNVWSFAGVCLMAAFGLNGRPWMYWGARPWCDDCDGTGYLPCQPQDMSVLRRWGQCEACGKPAWVLVHATKEQHGDIEGSARHADDQADHDVVVVAAPLVPVVGDYLDRHERKAI